MKQHSMHKLFFRARRNCTLVDLDLHVLALAPGTTLIAQLHCININHKGAGADIIFHVCFQLDIQRTMVKGVIKRHQPQE